MAAYSSGLGEHRQCRPQSTDTDLVATNLTCGKGHGVEIWEVVCSGNELSSVQAEDLRLSPHAFLYTRRIKFVDTSST